MSETPRTDAALEWMRNNVTDKDSDFVCASDMARLESELADKDRQLSEARAEIEWLKSEHEDSLRRAKDNAVSLSGTVTEYAGELLIKDRRLAEARADIEIMTGKLKTEREFSERRGKVIEQMRSALKALRKYPNTYIATGQGVGIAEKDLAMCDAALAAEREVRR